MNILFFTGHPAQIHNFRLVKELLENRGHNINWLATDKDISKYLLSVYDINYIELKKSKKSKLKRIIELINNTFRCIKFILNNDIDIIVSRVSFYMALAGWLTRRPSISLIDTESSGIYSSILSKFSSVILTSKSFKRNLRKDQIRFDGNIELFYLHPNRFKSAANVNDLLDLTKGESFVLMRFVSWDAYHDKGLTGFTDANKVKAVKEFSKLAKVFISAEGELPAELDTYRIKIPPEKMHDVLANASLFFGESATMASESAVLGTPAVYLDKIGRGYTDEEEEYGLVYNYNNELIDQEKAINKGIELLKTPQLKQEMNENRNNFLKDKIDVTAFMVWFIENYPESFKIMKENPEYQERFK